MAHVGRILVSTLVGIALLTGWTAFRIQEQGDTDERRPADAIVVLGA
ncbi:MAG: YdcF family protein, partial [Chloroflexota bacterium]